MDPQTQLVLQIAQLPFSVLLAIAIWKLYTDGKIDRDKAAQERLAMIDRLESVYQRVAKLQEAAGMDDPPTLPRRPNS